MKAKPCILSISLSDSSALRGVESDIKTAIKLNTYCTLAVTTVSSQNTKRFISKLSLSSSMVYDQIKAANEDFDIGAVKIGLISNINQAKAVKGAIDEFFKGVPIVLDPLIESKFGTVLNDEETLEYIKDNIFSKVSLITPNMKEASILSGLKCTNVDEMITGAKKIKKKYKTNVLITGGALEGEIKDVLVINGKETIIDRGKIHRQAFGLGSTVSTAIATYLAKGFKLEAAVRFALEYLNMCLNVTDESGVLWHK